MRWTEADAIHDLDAVGALLAGLERADAEARFEAVAEHFRRRYGEEESRDVLSAFIRLCLYVHHNASELAARGLLDDRCQVADRALLGALVSRLAAAPTGGGPGAQAASPAPGSPVAAVPAADVPEDAVEP